jgi:hypothetical protein
MIVSTVTDAPFNRACLIWSPVRPNATEIGVIGRLVNTA